MLFLQNASRDQREMQLFYTTMRAGRSSLLVPLPRVRPLPLAPSLSLFRSLSRSLSRWKRDRESSAEMRGENAVQERAASRTRSAARALRALPFSASFFAAAPDPGVPQEQKSHAASGRTSRGKKCEGP